MRNAQIKHSDKLVDADLDGEREMADFLTRHGGKPDPVSLEAFKAKPGYYICFAPHRTHKGSLKGPFDNEEQAREAHREWMWESKHS